MDLKGTVAIVTGGGTGIGRAVCLELARAGARGIVVGYSRSAQEADRTAEEIRGLGCDAVAHRANVASDAECREMVRSAVERFGRLDVLVNNAGTTRFIARHDLEAVTEEAWDSIFAVNVKGTFQCSRAAAPELRRTRGAIVNVASIAGWRAAGSSIPYGASKAALVQLTRNLAEALAPEVRVNSVSPGLVKTRWFRQPFGDEAANLQEALMAAATPLAEVAGPEHVAEAVRGLLLMDMVTGENVIVDGGAHLLYGPSSPNRKA